MDKNLRELVKKTFELDELPEVVSQETVEQWDSLGHLQLILAIERKFDVKFKSTIIPDLVNLEKIEEAINECR